jgi:hypothetical protein
MNRYIPGIWSTTIEGTNDQTWRVIFESKKNAVVLVHVDSDHLAALNSAPGYLGETGDIRRRIAEDQQRAVNPPAIAEFLLTMLATTRRAEAMIGDLNERFTRECQECGHARAVRLYWARTLRSVGPLLWRATAKVVRWGVVLAALRRLF